MKERVECIVDMLYDCMEGTEIRSKRPLIAKLIEEGYSDQVIYEHIAWGDALTKKP